MNNTTVEECKRKACSARDSLRSLETLCFQVSDTRLANYVDQLMLTPDGVRFRLIPDSLLPGQFALRLSAPSELMPLVQQLVVGFFDVDGRLIVVKRTDLTGTCCVRLPAGDFSVRFVDDIRDEQDADLLASVGDAFALEQLELAVEIEDTPELLRNYILFVCDRAEQTTTFTELAKNAYSTNEADGSYKLAAESHGTKNISSNSANLNEVVVDQESGLIRVLLESDAIPLGFVWLHLYEVTDNPRCFARWIFALQQDSNGNWSRKIGLQDIPELSGFKGRLHAEIVPVVNLDTVKTFCQGGRASELKSQLNDQLNRNGDRTE